jgi:hypothetical protein
MTDTWDGPDGVAGSRLGSAPRDAGFACGGGLAARVLASAGKQTAATGAVARTAKAAA